MLDYLDAACTLQEDVVSAQPLAFAHSLDCRSMYALVEWKLDIQRGISVQL